MEFNLNIQIVEPCSTDWPKVKAIRLEALQNDPQAFGSTYEKESLRTDEEWMKSVASSEDEIFVCAEAAGKYIALVGAFQKDQNTWMVKAMYVQSEYRGTGVSDALMQKIVSTIAAKSPEAQIKLMVNVTQLAAVRFYERHGFVIVETLKDQLLGDGKVYDEYVMRKEK